MALLTFYLYEVENLRVFLPIPNKKRPKGRSLFGAGKETQTPGLFLGKEALYQLSYTRLYRGKLYGLWLNFASYLTSQ